MPKFFGGILWGAHQRFFGQMVMAAKVPHIVDLVKMSVAEGKCCVIGLQSTGEASSEHRYNKTIALKTIVRRNLCTPC